MSNTLLNTKETLLSPREVMDLFKISPGTLWAWEKKGLLKKHKMERRVYYLESEIMNTLKAK